MSPLDEQYRAFWCRYGAVAACVYLAGQVIRAWLTVRWGRALPLLLALALIGCSPNQPTAWSTTDTCQGPAGMHCGCEAKDRVMPCYTCCKTVPCPKGPPPTEVAHAHND